MVTLKWGAGGKGVGVVETDMGEVEILCEFEQALREIETINRKVRVMVENF